MKHKFLFLAVLLSTLFTTSLWAQTPGYAIFGDKPYGYTDLRDQIEVSIPAVITGQDINSSSSVYAKPVNNNSISFTGQGLSGGHACQNYASLSIRFASAQTMTLTDNMTIHIKIKRADDKTSGLIRLSMIKGTWGAARLSFQIANNEITTSISEYVLSYQAPLTSFGVSTYNQAQLVGSSTNGTPVDVSYAGGNWNELFRFEAANGEKFEITQIYIKADSNPDPVDPNECTDEDDPTGLTLAASNIQDKSVTLTASANDAASSISYEFFYKAEGDAEFTSAGTASATPNTDATKEVKGLAPETNYTFKVVATDPCNNETEFVKPEEVQTLAFVERRYYFFRGDPASVTLPSTGVISYDLRRGVKTNVAPQNGMTLTENKYFSHFAKSGNWWSFNQSLSASFDMSEISQADWYLVVKFRTDYTSNSFNIRLNDGISYQVSQNNLSISTDGTWNVLTLALADAKNALTYSAFSTNQMLFQFHADNGAGSYLDIAYAYLTNLASSVDDLADNTNPVISALSDGDKTTTSVVLNVTASDDSGEDITYIVKEGTTVLTSTPATGVSGAAVAITVSELEGQDHTLTVIARDGAGNEVSQNIVVTLPAAVAPPSNLVVTTTNTDKSVTFTMSADDDNASLVYAILDGSDNVLVDNIAGTAGVETVYTLHGLTPETEYSFKVRVTNAASLSTTSDAINITTDALSEHRFYLTRGNNTDPLPESSNLTSNYVDCNVEFGNAARDNRASDYISTKTGKDWFAITFKPKATVANEIDDNWYIVVRFRSNLSNNVFGFNNFRLNLNNDAQNWYINNSDGDKPWGRDYYDGNWIVIKKRIGDRRAGSAVPASYLQASQVAAQLHVSSNLIAGEFLDVDYVYFTDDITNVDEGTQFNKRIALKDAEDNASVLSANNSQTVDIDLTRSLTNASYNTLCLPFDLSAEQVANIFGAGTTIGKLTSARIKENDELYLNFSFVDAIEAGVPYLIQPENNVANPLIENVTIDNTLRPADFEDVDFKGVFNPTEIQVQSADSYTILLLAANNTLSWPNETANMKGMRAYFDLSTQAASVVRRARFGFESEQTATGIDQISNDQSQITNKVVIDGQLIIIRDGVRYNVMGTKLQ